ncbi:MAG: trypsin-like peptidase domain-containing protein [Clostridia bacterium]|nr:trypsin-like peptidase domain-containing protein [Clostridia bacterium]
MKKFRFSFISILIIFLLSLSFVGCATKPTTPELPPDYETPDQPLNYSVTFVCDFTDYLKTVSVEEGKTVSTPKDPERDNYIFCGWYDEDFLEEYDFSQAVSSDLTLHAKYRLDGVTLTNSISTDLIKGVVKVYNRCYNANFFGETGYSLSQGSGFCFKIENGNYFILTNNHVISKNSSYSYQKFTVEDYQGKTYEAQLYNSAKSSAYDLACLYFTTTTTNVKALSLTTDDPSVSSDVISLGAPNSQANSITYGKISDYDTVTLSSSASSDSKITFEVIYHNAIINNGSSGGPLLNSDLKVVGVNYAGQKDTDLGFAIPISKVQEFLTQFVYA